MEDGRCSNAFRWRGAKNWRSIWPETTRCACSSAVFVQVIVDNARPYFSVYIVYLLDRKDSMCLINTEHRAELKTFAARPPQRVGTAIVVSAHKRWFRFQSVWRAISLLLLLSSIEIPKIIERFTCMWAWEFVVTLSSPLLVVCWFRL